MERKTIVVVKGIVMFNEKILLVKRSEKNKVGAGTWEFVGGKLGTSEELEEALIREVEEETGIAIKPQKLLFASTIHDDPSRQIVFLNYLCEAKSDLVCLSEEHTDYRWVTKSELRDYLSPTIIRDLETNQI